MLGYNCSHMTLHTTLRLGLEELKVGLTSHEQWLYMAVQDIKLRYRRSMIGPWWVTTSTGVMVPVVRPADAGVSAQLGMPFRRLRIAMGDLTNPHARKDCFLGRRLSRRIT